MVYNSFMRYSDFCDIMNLEVIMLNTVVKINYLLEIPMNQRFKEGYFKFLKEHQISEKEIKPYQMEKYLKASIEDELNNLRKTYVNFDGKFSIDIRKDRITGIFFDKSHVSIEVDEPLRRALFDRFSELLGNSDLRVDINLSCNLGN